MKTIKVITCNLLLVLTILPIVAQNSRNYKESFDVKQNPQLEVNLSNADIRIETWSKNKIQVNATLSYKGNNAKKADSLFKKYPIEILGNSSIVKITSSNDKHFSNLSLSKRRINKIRKKRRELVNRRKELLKQRKRILKERKERKKRRQEIIEKRSERLQRLRERRKNAIESGEKASKRIEEAKRTREKKDSLRKEMRIADNKMNDDRLTESIKEDNQQRASDADSWSNNSQIDRKIVIKVPEDIKVNINANQSYIKIENVGKLRANIGYSRLEIGKLVRNQHNIKSEFSVIVIEEIKKLDLEIRHAKNVELKNIGFLKVKTNASNLKIGKLDKEAVINGRLGKIHIDKIGKDFELIDIDLKNSEAILNLPDVDYQFFGNMQSCKVDINDLINLNKRSSFDKVIYRSKKINYEQMININAAFSNISLQ